MKTSAQISMIGSILLLLHISYNFYDDWFMEMEEYIRNILFGITAISSLVYIKLTSSGLKLSQKLTKLEIENKILKLEVENKNLQNKLN